MTQSPNPKSRREEVKAMSDEELRCAIGQLRGWQFAPANGPLDLPWRNTKVPAWDGTRWSGRADMPPNYPGDLNAIHHAENSLSDELFGQFVDRLKAHYVEVTRGCTSDGAYSAPPRVRAECLILTLTESPNTEERL